MLSATAGASTLFCDTSFFYAVLDQRDRDHIKARRLAEGIQRRGIPMITTWEVVVETITLLRYRYSYRAAMTFIERVLPKLNIVYITPDQRAKAIEGFGKLSLDKEISLCDAISHVVVSEVLHYIPCLSFGDDFKRLGLTVIERL
jgi:predicted nucleic acid-binding protein